MRICILFLALLASCSSTIVPLEKTTDGNHNPVTKTATDEVKPTPSIKNCICTQQWMPVCGENGKTYSNGCFAKCAGVKYSIGSCEKSLD